MDDFELEIKKEFIAEGLVNLEETESAFMELETASEKGPLLDKIFRMAHNMKGGSRAVGFGGVAEFTHELENFVLKIKKDTIPLNSAVVTILLRCNDRLIEMLNALSTDMAATCDNSDLMTLLTSPVEGGASAPASSSEAQVHVEVHAAPTIEIVSEAPSMPGDSAMPPSAGNFFDEEPAAPVSTPEVHAAPTLTVVPAVAAEAKKSDAPKKAGDSAPADEVVRVSLSKIEMLNDFVGELIVLQSVIQEQVALTTGLTLQGTVGQMTKLSKEIQNLSMGLRMLPIKPVIQKLQRVVRDTSKMVGKEVELVVEGDQIEVEKMVLDMLVDPLIHILRNSVDHGIEATKEDRIAAGKSHIGKVLLKFQNDGNHLVIEIKDDGKGINPAIIRTKAIEKGIIREGDAMTEKQLVNLIFNAGFSTKAVTSEVSGRGVGMDVVKTNVEKIGGNIDVQSNVGTGSLFKLQIPLSLAVIEGLIVTAAKGRFVVPLSQVQETINIASQTIYKEKAGIGSCFELRGKVIPIVTIESALRIPVPQASVDGTGELKGIALIVNVNDQPVAFVVNDILRSQQIVVKPIENGLVEQKGWVGTCILGDGMPTLIVSPKDLLSAKFDFKKDLELGRSA